MNKEALDLGRNQFAQVTGLADMDRDEDGFIILKPTAHRIDQRSSELTTDISNLEAKLKKFKQEKEKTEKLKKTEEYKTSKKILSKKKAKKQKTALLEMVFNNADAVAAEEAEADDDEDGSYRDSRKGKKGEPKKKADTLDTTYGKRFSPVVAMLHDTIVEFDSIAADIEAELKDPRNQGKSMYRSSQLGNLISAKNSKLSAVRELATVATTVSNLEYKKEKDAKGEDGGDTTRIIASLGSKYLRGAFDPDDDGKKGKKGSKGKKDSGKSKKSRPPYVDDDDDDEVDEGIKKQRESDQKGLADELAKALVNKKKDMNFTPHERYIRMEGKYTILVVCDPVDPDNTWKFVAVDPKSGKEIKDFKDDYPGLFPKKKNCRMIFDLGKNRCTDKNSSRTYKLLYKD